MRLLRYLLLLHTQLQPLSRLTAVTQAMAAEQLLGLIKSMSVLTEASLILDGAQARGAQARGARQDR